jgi:hypothetical protein
MEEESPEPVADGEGEKEPPLKVEIGGEVEVTGGREGIEVGSSKQTSNEPGLTVITGVSLLSPLESWRTMTTLVPTGIVIGFQVNEVPATLVKAARMVPPPLPE